MNKLILNEIPRYQTGADELKQCENAFPHLKYSVKIDNDFAQSCHGLICYYGFSISRTVILSIE